MIGGRGCCWLRSYLFENSPRIFYFTPGNFSQNKPLPLQTPQNCVTPLGNFKRPRITRPLEISRFFPDHCCNKNFHIVFSKSLDILLTIPSIPLETPILILFLFSNMLFCKIYSRKCTCGKAHIN